MCFWRFANPDRLGQAGRAIQCCISHHAIFIHSILIFGAWSAPLALRTARHASELSRKLCARREITPATHPHGRGRAEEERCFLHRPAARQGVPAMLVARARRGVRLLIFIRNYLIFMTAPAARAIPRSLAASPASSCRARSWRTTRVARSQFAHQYQADATSSRARSARVLRHNCWSCSRPGSNRS